LSGPGALADREIDLQDLQDKPRRRNGLGGIRGVDARVQPDLDDLPVRAAAAPVLPAAQSAGTRRGAAGTCLQHRRKLHDQYQLASILGRADAELSDADGRADVAQLSLGGGWNRDGGGGYSRV